MAAGPGCLMISISIPLFFEYFSLHPIVHFVVFGAPPSRDFSHIMILFQQQPSLRSLQIVAVASSDSLDDVLVFLSLTPFPPCLFLTHTAVFGYL